MSSTIDYNNDGHRIAQAAWDSKTARWIVCGYFNPDQPTPINPQSGLLYRHHFSREFARDHNSTIVSLVEQFGIPAWSPQARLPDAQKIRIDISLETHDFPDKDNFPSSFLPTASLIQRTWPKGKIDHWAQNRESRMLYLFGMLSSRTGRVDVIDTTFDDWVASKIFKQEHQNGIPWIPNLPRRELR